MEEYIERKCLERGEKRGRSSNRGMSRRFYNGEKKEQRVQEKERGGNERIGKMKT